MCRHKEHVCLIVTLGALLSFAACAIITVNVYFPEKDVKAAYKSLEDELLEPAPKKPGPARRPSLAAAWKDDPSWLPRMFGE